MAFIRKVKTLSGATAVQIAHKTHGRISRIEHIGSAHSDKELSLLLSLAKQRLLGSQQSLFAEPEPMKVRMLQSMSTVLFDTLTDQYNALGFDQLKDPDFASLCIARLVEPTSKLDTVRVLADLGKADGISKSGLHRCLKRIITNNYQDKLAKLCFTYAATQGSGITLVLYDVTTLYFEVQKEDEYRIPGMSKERRLEPQVIVGLLVDQNGFPIRAT